MKKFFALILALVMALSLVACGGGDEGGKDVKMRFVTGGESGTYYAFGGTIAQHATNAGKGIQVIGVVGNGSQGNVEALQSSKAELAFCQSDVMSYAYDGTRLFEESGKVDNFSTVAALYNEQVQIVTCDPDIKSVADLKGKKVSLGSAGSGVYFNAMDVLGAYGLTEDDILPTYQSFGDTVNDIKDGKIDAGFMTAGAPTTAVVDLSTTKDTYVLSIDEEHVDALVASSPFYQKAIIPKEVYGTDEDITTVAVGAVILARNDVPEDAIYALTADIFDNYQDLVANHAKYGELSLEYATSITTVPYHAGAAKYFAEKGIEVPVVAE